MQRIYVDYTENDLLIKGSRYFLKTAIIKPQSSMLLVKPDGVYNVGVKSVNKDNLFTEIFLDKIYFKDCENIVVMVSCKDTIYKYTGDKFKKISMSSIQSKIELLAKRVNERTERIDLTPDRETHSLEAVVSTT